MNKQLPLLTLVLLSLLPGLASPALASDEVCYIIADTGGTYGSGNDLLTRIDKDNFDLATNEFNIGTGTGTTNVETMTLQSGTGLLYTADGDRLGTLDLNTGVFTPRANALGTGRGARGPISFTDIDGLSFDPRDGTLYGANRDPVELDVLIKIDPFTGLHIPDAFGPGVDYIEIQPLPDHRSLRDIDDITFDPFDGQLYASLNQGGADARLVIINTATGTTTDIGAFNIDDVEGLTFDHHGQLWATTGNKSRFPEQNDRFWEIDKGTGVASNPRPVDNGTDYEGAACYPFDPTAIQLVSFNATPRGDMLAVQWTTSAEVNTWGFYLYRSTDRGRAGAVRITPELILAQGRGAGGASYSWLDREAEVGVTYTYWLQEIELNGSVNEYGPISATRPAAVVEQHVFLPLVSR